MGSIVLLIFSLDPKWNRNVYFLWILGSFVVFLNLFPLRQFCSRRLWTYFVKKWKISIIEWITYDKKWKNIVAKGEIARFVQFLRLTLCFQKAVCCRGVKKASIWRKGLYIKVNRYVGLTVWSNPTNGSKLHNHSSKRVKLL